MEPPVTRKEDDAPAVFPVPPVPPVRAARTLQEALAIPGDGRTATSLVAACQGRMEYLTPGAYADHVAPYLASDAPEAYAQRWCELVELVRRRSSDIDALVDELHTAARQRLLSGRSM